MYLWGFVPIREFTRLQFASRFFREVLLVSGDHMRFYCMENSSPLTPPPPPPPRDSPPGGKLISVLLFHSQLFRKFFCPLLWRFVHPSLKVAHIWQVLLLFEKCAYFSWSGCHKTHLNWIVNVLKEILMIYASARVSAKARLGGIFRFSISKYEAVQLGARGSM